MENLNRIPLNGLRAVEAVARLGSLRAAADNLGVSIGAVSQQVTRTEAALGRSLFARRPGGMVPTPASAEICRLLSAGFGQIAAAVDLSVQARSDILTISVAPIFAARWLIWRLPEFYAAHPEIKIRLDSNLALVDLASSDVDFSIRIGPGGYSGVTAEHLFDQRVVPVCNAALAERIHAPGDLAEVPVIRELRPMFDWDVWLGPEGLDNSILGDGPEFSEASLCLDAAMIGGGVFLAFETLCRDALDRGQITAPMPVWRKTGLSYWLLSARDRNLSVPQREFRQWLKATLAKSGLGDA